MSSGGLQFSERVRALPFSPGVVPVLEGPGGLVAVNKPTRVRSHPNQAERVDSGALLAAPYSFEGETYLCSSDDGSTVPVHLINRLDAPTSGLVLLALDAELAAVVRQKFKERMVKKRYKAVVFGKASPSVGQWTTPLIKKQKGDRVRSQTARPGRGIPASTRYAVRESVASEHGKLSLLELHPETGRTHQLRIHCADHGVPIVGDQTYGDFKANRALLDMIHCGAKKMNRLFLHAEALSFQIEWKGKTFDFSAEALLPGEFLEIIKGKAEHTASRRFRRS